jgi:hypothetical protein
VNIFVVHFNPEEAAKSLCDQHVVKMILESAQLLCGPFEEAPYKRTHFNHPCAKWVREGKLNYGWLLTHAKALCEEYTYRYGKRHKSQEVIEWCEKRFNSLTFPHTNTPFVKAVAEEFKSLPVVEAYREYYNQYKTFARWTKRTPPAWYRKESNGCK